MFFDLSQCVSIIFLEIPESPSSSGGPDTMMICCPVSSTLVEMRESALFNESAKRNHLISSSCFLGAACLQKFNLSKLWDQTWMNASHKRERDGGGWTDACCGDVFRKVTKSHQDITQHVSLSRRLLKCQCERSKKRESISVSQFGHNVNERFLLQSNLGGVETHDGRPTLSDIRRNLRTVNFFWLIQVHVGAHVSIFIHVCDGDKFSLHRMSLEMCKIKTVFFPRSFWALRQNVPKSLFRKALADRRSHSEHKTAALWIHIDTLETHPPPPMHRFYTWSCSDSDFANRLGSPHLHGCQGFTGQVLYLLGEMGKN